MTSDEKLFINIDKSLKSRVRIGNGEYLEVKGKETVAIESCAGTKLVSDVKRDKLGEKAEPGIFVGYSLVSKAYRIYQPQTGKVITSRDVHVVVLEPAGYEEAKSDQRLMNEMKEELAMIEKNQTWELVERPKDRKVIGVKWVFKTKLNPDGSVNKQKARLVVKGYAQVWGVDFSETFAPVARLDTIRMTLALATQQGWKVYQLDVKSAFFNGVLQEEIYVEQPEDFVTPGQEEKVYLLRKALYGLRQAPRAWYSKMDEHLLGLDFKKSLSESTLYVKNNVSYLVVVSLYVDDMLVIGSNSDQITAFKQEMMKRFEMTDLGEMSYFLGMEVRQTQNEVFICQNKYLKEILKRFNMEECKSVNTPMGQKEKLQKKDGSEPTDKRVYRSLIDCLMYLTATRPDIMFPVSVLSRFLNCVSELHMVAAKSVLRYLKGTISYGIKFCRVQEFKL
uniref:Uncharacterized protein n=1 Tax=Ananas comosus var. bracteatus TaxID=296719 RepID=A0A6V7Q648_ANACO|nr:unnamed protein product [Ananas comosus var. bracteatus]